MSVKDRKQAQAEALHDSDGASAGTQQQQHKTDEIYHRIMRKLQRQANYSEMSSLPLRVEVLGSSQATVTVPQQVLPDISPANRSVSPALFKGGPAQDTGDPASPQGTLYDQLNDADEEKNFGLFPCPATLRTVVEYVLSTVTEKLTMSHLGSLKDCMRYTFECRSLLDKLLKEIPTYSHFAEHSTQPISSSTAAMSVRVQEMYQEFRKAPVVLPQARYAQSSETGKFLPEISAGKPPGGAVSPRQGDLVPVTKLRGAVAQHQPVPPSRPPASHRAGGQILGSLQQQMKSMASAAAVQRDRELLLRHLRRQTQVLSLGVQTDENMYSMVSREAYDHVLDEVAMLKVELCDLDATRQELIAKQYVALGVINTKANTVNYLRQTLYKECCILRQQLAVAHQKIQSMQAEAMQMLGSSSTMRGGSSFAASVMNSGHPASQALIQQQADSDIQINAVHSLLDLALLAVEKDKVIGPNGELIPNQNAVVAKLKDEMHHRQMQWKRDIVNIRGKFVLVLEEKNRQMKSVQLASNAKHLRKIINDKIHEIRADFSKSRFAVKEMLAEMRGAMSSLSAEVRQSLFKVDDQLLLGRSADFERRAVADLVKVTATNLIGPMLCEAYCFSNTSFLARHRPADPLIHYCQHTLPTQEMCLSVLSECETLQNLYSAIHRFVLLNCRPPGQTRPAIGPEFAKVALGLLGNPACSHDLTLAIRTNIEVDAELASRLAALNFQIKSVSHKQIVVQRLSEQSFVEAVIDISSHVLPVMHLVNRLGVQLGKLRNAKAELMKARTNNARELFKQWADSGLTLCTSPAGRRPGALRIKDVNLAVNVVAVSPTTKPLGVDFPAANAAAPKWAGSGHSPGVKAASDGQQKDKKAGSKGGHW
jgi:hypothetical protein